MRFACILSMWCCCVSSHAATVEARHTHGVFYPGLRNQPVLQLKVSGAPGERIKAVRVNLGKSSSKDDISQVRLLCSGDWNGFTCNTGKLAVEQDKAKPGKDSVVLKTKIELGNSPQYLWISYDLVPGAKRNARVDAQCSAVLMSDGSVVEPEEVMADGLKARVMGRVYPFP